MSETVESNEPVQEGIDYRKEYFALLKIVSTLGLQMMLAATNLENSIVEKESKPNS